MFQDVSCTADFTDRSYNMTWNTTTSLWEMNRTFTSGGIQNYNVTCIKGGYETQLASSSINITADNVNPTIDFVNFTTNTSSIAQGTIFANVSAFDLNLVNITVNLYEF